MMLSSPSVVEVSTDPAAWIAIVVAVIAVIGSVIAAVVAARSTNASKQSEIQAQRIIELENRISDRKYDLYKPMIEMLGNVMDTSPAKVAMEQDEIIKRLHEFFVWASIYGSDDTIIAFSRMQQAASNEAPVEISVRLYAELILAARRDIGRSDTQIGPVQIVGMKVNDLYTNGEYYDAMTLPFDKLCEKYHWTPPWTLPDSKRRPSLPPSS